jgi:hypothetical protein
MNKHYCLFGHFVIDEEKSFMMLTPVVNVTKLFFFFINKENTNRMKCFVLIEIRQPSLTFAMKAGEQGASL